MNSKNRLLLRESLQYFQQLLASKTVYVPLPVEAALFLTKRCNSRCSMCNYWKINDNNNKELTTGEVLRLLDELKDLGVVILSLSAEGEITLRKDLPLIIDRIKQHGFLYSVNSNFLDISSSDIFNSFYDYPPYQITVGIDTLNPEKYTLIRGVKKGLEKVLSNVKSFQEKGLRNISFGTVILPDNLDDLIELIYYVKKNRLKGIRFTAFQPSGFGKKWKSEELKRFNHPEFKHNLTDRISTLIKLKGKGASIFNSIPYMELIPQSFQDPFFFPLPCIIPWRRIHIFSNGNVSLCQVMEKRAIIGNWRNKSLYHLWYSNLAKMVREIVKKKKCGGCWLSCYQETNIRFSSVYGYRTIYNSLRRYIGL